MPVLQYQMTVLGANQVKAAITSVERAAAKSSANAQKAAAMAPTASRGGPYRTPAQDVDKARRMQALAERQRHADAIRNQAAESRARMRDIERENRARSAARRQEYRQSRRVAQAQAVATTRGGLATRNAMDQAALRSTAAVGRGAINVAAIGGTALVGMSIYRQAQLERDAALLANKAFGTGGDTRTREEIKASIMGQANTLGAVTGSRQNVVELVRQVHAKTGRLREAQALAPMMADLVDAYGGEPAAVGETIGNIMMSLQGRYKGKALIENTSLIARIWSQQAKRGSIEFADLAREGGKIMSATTGMQGDPVRNAAMIGGFAQLAVRGAAPGAAEAATGVLRMRDDLVKNYKRFASLKVGGKSIETITEGGRALTDPVQVVKASLIASGGDLRKLQPLFGIRGAKPGISPFIDPYRKRYDEAVAKGMSKSEAAKEAAKVVDEMIGEFMNVDPSMKTLQKDAKFTRMQDARQIQIAFAEVQAELGTELAPVLRDAIPSIKALAKEMAQLAPHVASALRVLADDPFGTILKVIAAKVAFDVAAAGIGQMIRNKLAMEMTLAGMGRGAAPGAAVAAGAKGAPAVMPGPMVAGVAAAVGVGLALDQARKLDREMGGPSVLKEIPGFRKGGFSVEDIFDSIYEGGVRSLPAFWGLNIAQGAWQGKGVGGALRGKAAETWSAVTDRGQFVDIQDWEDPTRVPAVKTRQQRNKEEFQAQQRAWHEKLLGGTGTFGERTKAESLFGEKTMPGAVGIAGVAGDTAGLEGIGLMQEQMSAHAAAQEAAKTAAEKQADASTVNTLALQANTAALLGGGLNRGPGKSPVKD